MFWTDWGRAAKIERAGMDGSLRHVIVSDDVMWPNSVAIDDRQDALYWTDAGLQRIETARLDGTGRKVTTLYVLIIGSVCLCVCLSGTT